MENYFIEKFVQSRSFIRFIKSGISQHDALVCDEDIWPFLVPSFAYSLQVPVFVLTATNDRANGLVKEMKMMLTGMDVLQYPGLGTAQIISDLKNSKALSGVMSQRFEILRLISEYNKTGDIHEKKQPFIILASGNAIVDLVPGIEKLNKNVLLLQKNNEYPREITTSALIKLGYERVGKVYDRGEFSFKGDVLDIFDVALKNPIRIDFFEDKVEDIYSYDSINYNKLKKYDNVNIFPNPNMEPGIDEDTAGNHCENVSIIDFIRENIPQSLFLVCDPYEVNLKVKNDIELIRKTLELENDSPAEQEKYYEYDQNPAVKIKDPDLLVEKKLIKSDFLEKLQEERFNNQILSLDILSTQIGTEDRKIFVFDNLRKQKKSQGNAELFIQNLKKDIKNNKTVVISIGNDERIERIAKFFTESRISFNRVPFVENSSGKGHESVNETNERTGTGFAEISAEPNPEFDNTGDSVVNIYRRNLLTGFENEDFSLYGELDIYQEVDPGTKADLSVYDLKTDEFNPGDYIVHKTHGIGKYVNIISEQINGNKKEFFLIEYADNDKLYVPVWQSDRLHKYVGDKVPVISSLSSRQWESLKKKVRTSVRQLAIDLASLYRDRGIAEGYEFTADSIWQKEMEDMFPFQETQDQVKAVSFVKELMEKPKPMDLLLCGDVGFGKTEVAVRAAFKAVENGKQVLMLVPTTILADQHFRTFSQRFKNFPVITEVISRFKTSKEQKNIIDNFANGKVDLLIGTHRILSADVKPRDLGLLIIDEEQRFGVNAKEKLKLLKKNVDVMTMSATPIPRTLYMSLTGVRDIFLIETHPSGRFPIETFVGEKNDLLIKMAVEREINRGGQVFYVYNRIKDIEEVRHRLGILLPGVKIALTHGRMEAREIEGVMEDFINKKYNVLLTTSIIESGMDISNVNTLIVENAHKFGLSQLYQLRGRVGRSHEKAYSYFFYPGKKVLNIQAFQRLKTLSEYTDLGSGYKIAMKDMEIRGAGEILGARQHGHINSVGFDLYCQIIKEEIDKLRGVQPEKEINIQIEIPVSAYVPKNYIRNEKERISLYKSIANIRQIEEADTIADELVRKHGKMPETVRNILNIGKIKCLAKKTSIEKIFYSKSRGGIIFKKIELNPDEIREINSGHSEVSYIQRTREIYIKCNEKELNPDIVLKNLNGIIALIKRH